ncbi:hypothetical protein [Solibacillus sp.]|uniref:hypothetical protein n=1 Tax=Solibacillus sp. TaxID=1909654 RepID=UPI003315597B
MQNTNLFEFIGVEADPVYKQLEQLQKGESFMIDGICVSLEKFYEIESDVEHVPFKTLNRCYQYLNNTLTNGGK